MDGRTYGPTDRSRCKVACTRLIKHMYSAYAYTHAHTLAHASALIHAHTLVHVHAHANTHIMAHVHAHAQAHAYAHI